MLRQLGRIALTVALASATLSGLARAGTGSPDPIAAVVRAVSDDRPTPAPFVATFDEASTPSPTATPVPTVTPEPKESPDPKESPEPARSPEPTPKAKARSTSGCPDGFDGNHGQFVSGSDDKRAAAHSDCGKPQSAGEKHADREDGPQATASPASTGAGHGSGDESDEGHHGQDKGDHGNKDNDHGNNGNDHGNRGGGKHGDESDS